VKLTNPSLIENSAEDWLAAAGCGQGNIL